MYLKIQINISTSLKAIMYLVFRYTLQATVKSQLLCFCEVAAPELPKIKLVLFAIIDISQDLSVMVSDELKTYHL